MRASDAPCSFPSWWMPTPQPQEVILFFCLFTCPGWAWPMVGWGSLMMETSFLWILLAHPFYSLTPRTLRVLCTTSDRAMCMGCWCLGVSMMLSSITLGSG